MPKQQDTPTGPSPEIVIVGGSLAGLLSAHALAETGIPSTVIERAPAAVRSGAALAVDAREVTAALGRDRSAAALGTSTSRGAMPVSWEQLHRGFMTAAQDDPLITLHHDTVVNSVAEHSDRVDVMARSGEQFSGDVLIGADGYRSIVRTVVSPEHPHADFAGYMLWLGVANEDDLPAVLSMPTNLDMRSSSSHFLLGYPLQADPDAGGGRRLGWAWYDSTRNDLLRETGSVIGAHAQHSLRPGDIPDTTYRKLATEARRHWSAPWRDAILHNIDQRPVTGVPITEHVPDRLVRGRIAIIGDAAHVPTPMTGSGFAASLADARSLARALAHSTAATAPVDLLDYEHDRLLDARQLVTSGKGFSRSFAGRQ